MAFVFPNQNPFTFQWTLLDANGTPVNDATAITATLYDGRSISLPEDVPGEPVEGFDGIELEYVADSAGVYEGTIAATFNPGIGGDYILVVDAVRSFQTLGHWEVPAIVQERTS